MYWFTLYYLRWVAFWRLPETAAIRRACTPSYLRRVEILRLVWLFLVIGLALIGQLVVLIAGLLLMTFLSFMFLDEAQPVTEAVKHRSKPRK